MFIAKRFRTPVAILFVSLFAACGGGGGAPAPAPVTLTAISITPANQSLRFGATRQLNATGSYSDSSTQDITASVTWASSAGTSVSNIGLATAAAIGNSTITATLGATTGTTTVIVSAVSLPKTGQTTCYDAAGAGIACLGTGQDGELQTGVTEPSPRFTVGTGATAACVTDNLTGLMWAQDANLPAGMLTWQQALDYANTLNLCSFTDWRLPNVNELEGLVNSQAPIQAISLNTLGFSNVQAATYWSSSSSAYSANFAWIVNMYTGYVSAIGLKSDTGYVWPVRAGQ